MKQKLLMLLCCIVFTVAVNAQGKYRSHVIAQGETLSMIAEKYNSTVGDIMRLNGMHASSVLKLGEKIKIPAATVNGKKVPAVKPPAPVTAPVAVAVPVKSGQTTHTVQQSETLYGISKKYGVTIDQIKEWNNIPDLNISIGQQLSINGKAVAAVTAEKKPETTVVETVKPIADEQANTVEEKIKEVEKPSKTNQEKKVKEPSVAIVPANNNTPKNTAITGTTKDGSDSYFSADFTAATKKSKLRKASGDAMTFKTASGWIDKKYYVLMNEIPAGTIVKINADNGNTIFAKVLWQLEDMKLNQGLSFRLSEAAAAALGIAFIKFPLTVEYYQ